jgi:uncharacterized protein YydD (DUF2326 family)
MIKAVRCDQTSFREVRFKPGLNVIAAERIRESTGKDSRNGLGKTLLIEIIHFCLGASTKKNEGLRIKNLENWTFILDVTLKGKDYSIYRNTLDSSRVQIEGDVSGWPIKPGFDHKERKYILSVKDWNLLLGFLVFGLPVEIANRKYSPTFRSLISYFIRRGVSGFISPFKHYPQQNEWDIQVNNAFLLGLNWEYASDFQVLKDNEKILNELKKAANQGLLTGYAGSMGELEAERVRLEDQIAQLDSQLKTFKVHPQYFRIQEETNRLTKEIHDITNNCTINQRILDKYKESITAEKDVSLQKVEQVYKESGLLFPDNLLRKLDEVSDFHETIIENRKTYLKTENDRLARKIEKQKFQIQRISDKRAELLKVLETHGALEEYTKLQERAASLRQRLEEVKNRKENLTKFEEGKSSLKIARAELFQNTRRDYMERLPGVEKAIKIFNRNSEKLYNEPGMLSIDITENGYKYNVEIKRARSQGIGYMKVFCYDLMLTRLFSKFFANEGFLVHDSTIFDGVDERQIAKALELAAEESQKEGFQYICALNSDNIPYDDFSDGFKSRFADSIIITFNDAADDGGLLGIRF